MEKPHPTILTIGIAGGTGAGKTTWANELYARLGGEKTVIKLSHDFYYKDLTKTIPSLEERAKENFDHPNALDTDLLVQHVRDLKLGRSIRIPKYDFATHSRLSSSDDNAAIQYPQKILLIEGILIFNCPELIKEMDIKIFMDAAPDVRLCRRIIRDTTERGRSMKQTTEQYLSQVRPMHEEWVEPSKKNADFIINSNTIKGFNVALQVLTNHILVATDHITTKNGQLQNYNNNNNTTNGQSQIYSK